MSEDRSMRAITIATAGGPEVLQLSEVKTPLPAPGEVVIDVVATAINRADILQRQGHYPPPAGASEYPGLECAGLISALGEGVTGWKIGDEVCALLAGGGYAEQVAAPVGQLLPIPTGIGLLEAAALPEAAATSWFNLFSLAHISPGETVLIHGGSGGIGTFAIQLATAYGIQVLCTASTAKIETCHALGAVRAIDYRTEDFVKVVAEFTQGIGVDVILDTVGAKYLSSNLQALATNGRLVTIGLQGGRKAELDLSTVMQKRIELTGSTLRSQSPQQKAEILAELREHVWPLLAAGRIRPFIDRAFALADVAKAHAYLEEGKHLGKVLLVR